jgi:DNA repair protein RadC
LAAPQSKKGAVQAMKTIYEIQRIKQVIQEVEGGEKYIIRSPEDAAKIASYFIGDEDREVFFVMCLNTKNHVVAVHRCHVGALNASIVHPREVLKTAILNNSASIIVAHQHPSQDTRPSREDIEVTQRLVEAGKILGIEVLDHLIVNEKANFTSLKEKGHI